jgi:hypothetical protein
LADFAGTTVDQVTAKMGDKQEKLKAGLGQVLFKSNSATNAKLPAYVAIDVDSLDQQALLGDESGLLIELLVSFNQKVNSAFPVSGNIVLYSQAADSAALKRLEEVTLKNAHRFQGLSIGFVDNADPSDMKSVFERARIAMTNFSDKNAYVLSTVNSGQQGAQFIKVTGIPHLALATFAYTHYKNGGDVLDGLMALFGRYLPELDMAGKLTNKIATELIAAIQA